MKKLFVSVGLAAAGTASLQISSAFALDATASKLWSVSASLRGFYDDNYDTLNQKRGSVGFEVTPQLTFSIPLQQTEIGMRYTYGLYYYQDRQDVHINPIDQSHQVDLWVDHSFTERWQAKLEDTLSVGQEPELIQGGTPFRVNGNNIANAATLSLHTDWTRLFSTEATYQNKFYDYEDSGATISDILPLGDVGETATINNIPYVFGPYPAGTGRNATYAGSLNRVENSFNLDLAWAVAKETSLSVGAQYGQVNYIANEPIAFSPQLAVIRGNPGQTNNPGNPFYYSKDRDSRTYVGYVGIQHKLLQNLNVYGRVGISYVESYNDPLSSPTLQPYAAFSLTYTYLPGCYAQLGFNHNQNSTDVVSVNTTDGRITQFQESSSVYGSINHQLTSKLLGSIIANLQNSTFNGGADDNASDVDFNLGLNLKYTFNRHVSAEVGYNYDQLTSSIIGRAYNRNRVYFGLAAAY